MRLYKISRIFSFAVFRVASQLTEPLEEANQITKCSVPGDCATECPGMGIDSWYDEAF